MSIDHRETILSAEAAAPIFGVDWVFHGEPELADKVFCIVEYTDASEEKQEAPEG